jgi:hypothetical protein
MTRLSVLAAAGQGALESTALPEEGRQGSHFLAQEGIRVPQTAPDPYGGPCELSRVRKFALLARWGICPGGQATPEPSRGRPGGRAPHRVPLPRTWPRPGDLPELPVAHAELARGG